MVGNLFTTAGQLLAAQFSVVCQVIGALIMALLAGALSMRGWHKRQKAQGKSGVQAWHLISSGLAGVAIFALISLAGVIWQMRDSGPSVRSQLENATADQANTTAQLKASETSLKAVAQELVQTREALASASKWIPGAVNPPFGQQPPRGLVVSKGKFLKLDQGNIAGGVAIDDVEDTNIGKLTVPNNNPSKPR
jgi:hypothetical protein